MCAVGCGGIASKRRARPERSGIPAVGAHVGEAPERAEDGERPRSGLGLAHRPIRGRSSMKQTVSQKLIDRPGNSALLLHEARETTGHAHDCTSLLEFPSSTESDVCATAPQPLQYLKRLSCLWNAMVLKSCCEKKKLAVLW